MKMEGPNFEIHPMGTGSHLGNLDLIKERLDQIETDLASATGEALEKLEKEKAELTLQFESERKAALN